MMVENNKEWKIDRKEELEWDERGKSWNWCDRGENGLMGEKESESEGNWIH